MQRNENNELRARCLRQSEQNDLKNSLVRILLIFLVCKEFSIKFNETIN